MIASYADLRAAILAWPDLTGEENLEANVDTIISLGEARVNRELRLQRMIAEQVVPATGTAATEHELPDDFLEMDRVTGADGESLESRPADEFVRYGPKHCLNRLGVYAIDGARVLFDPKQDGFTLRYYARLPAISSVAHWLFLREPGLYLYAALMETGTFSKEAEQEYDRYLQAYQQIVTGLLVLDEAYIQPRSQPLRAVVNGGRKQRIM